MAFTRFHDDPLRIKKQIEESTGLGRYQLDTPGNGLSLPYFEDPHIRLQKWGANLRNNSTNLESDLFGITRKLTHANIDYLAETPNTAPLNLFSTLESFVDESRSTHPAWMYKDLEQSRYNFSLLDRKINVEIPFENNASSRIQEKDMYLQKLNLNNM